MKAVKMIIFSGLLATLFVLGGCQKTNTAGTQKKTIVVTYSALASIVKDLVGDSFVVKTSIPNGLDPHEWEPSAKDIEALNKANLIVENGLSLEGGMEKALARAREKGVKFFTASEHIKIRKVGFGEGLPSGDPDQAVGASDPHLWMDPMTVKAVVMALAEYLKTAFSTDVSANAEALEKKLDLLDAAIKKEVSSIPPAKRKLVTGHESLGYFAQRYGFKLVGAIIPNLSTQAEVSASDMANLIKLIRENRVSVVFTELGTPPQVCEALAKETGVKTVPLTTHSLPPDLSYFVFIKNLADAIAKNLR